MNRLILAPVFARNALATKRSLLFDGVIRRSLNTTQPVLAGFTKDYKPGPYPKTEQERIAAAKKYGLRPEDYEPYPDDGLGFGDYPNLGNISTDMKSDFDEYDDFYLKRNFGEPVHILQEQITADKTSYRDLGLSHKLIMLWFLFGGSLFFGLNYFLWGYQFYVPIAQKQYPRNVELFGEKHYKI